MMSTELAKYFYSKAPFKNLKDAEHTSKIHTM